jgi:pimeloyl-ACP methyl ester carboxylesterase
MHVDVNGMRMWFDVEGAGLVPDGSEMRERPTVVLVHGGPGSFDHSYLKPDFTRLAEVAQVVYLDLPDHGRSDWGDPDAWSFELCADAVRGLCDALGIESPVVYGHSLGGFVALVYAVRHPGHAGALVLQSTFGRFDLDRIEEEFRRRGGEEAGRVARLVYGGERDSVTDEEWQPVWKLIGHWVPGDEEDARTIVNREVNRTGGDAMRRFDVLGELSVIERPVLVCVGEIDAITPVSAAREIHAALPAGNARLEIVEDAGHFTWRDAPDRYWPLLLDFVRTYGEPRRVA